MKRWPIIILAVALILGVGIVVGYHAGVRILRDKVVESLGPGSQITELKVNWYSLEVAGLRIDAPKGWPTARTVEAERITIVPSLLSLMTKEIKIASVEVDRPYLSVLRVPGKLIMIPSLTEETKKKNKRSAGAVKPSGSRVKIATITLKDGYLELFDATVSRPPLKTRIERINGVIQDVAFPAAAKTLFDLAGIVKGQKGDGTAKITGCVGPGARD